MDADALIQEQMLAESLSRLSLYTMRGQTLADQSISLLERVAGQAAEEVRRAETAYDAAGLQEDDVRLLLSTQLGEVRRELDLLPSEVRTRLRKLPQGSFAITLFGRTEVGKSTLANVLTNGRASRIGEGGQRTTRHVHTYEYQGIKVTDVPGIGAIEGTEDEYKAMEAARCGDLVLYLITENGFQKAEADFLAKVKALGKPMICMVNVKANCNLGPDCDEEDIEYVLENVEEAFEDADMYGAVRRGMLAFAEKYGQDWSQIPFCYVHLGTALLAQDKDYAPWAWELRQASRIDDAMKQIVEVVRGKGCYMRLKSYVDTVSGPLATVVARLSAQSASNAAQARILYQKLRDYESRVRDFSETCKARVGTLADNALDELRGEATVFAENHFEDRNASKKWTRIVASKGFEKRAKKLYAGFSREAEQKLRDIGRELDFALSAINSSGMRVHIEGKPIVNPRRIVEQAIVVAGVGLGIAGAISGSGAIAAAGVAVGVAGSIIPRFLKGYDEQKSEYIEAFRKQLDEDIDNYVRELRENLMEELNRVIDDHLLVFSAAMRGLAGSLVDLSDAQRRLTRGAGAQMTMLTGGLLLEALQYRGLAAYATHVSHVARDVGNVTVIALDYASAIPTEVRSSLKDLLDEDIDVIKRERDGCVRLDSLITHHARRGIMIEQTIEGITFGFLSVQEKATPAERRAQLLCSQLADIIKMD